jgi:hypothetical protein
MAQVLDKWKAFDSGSVPLARTATAAPRAVITLCISLSPVSFLVSILESTVDQDKSRVPSRARGASRTVRSSPRGVLTLRLTARSVRTAEAAVLRKKIKRFNIITGLLMAIVTGERLPRSLLLRSIPLPRLLPQPTDRAFPGVQAGSAR